MDNDSHLLDLEQGFMVEFTRPNQNVYCPHCETEGESKSPSCSANINGYYRCQSCGKRGYVTQFYAAKMGISTREARDKLLIRDAHRRNALTNCLRDLEYELRERKSKSSLSTDVVNDTAQILRTHAKWLPYLVEERCLTTDTIVQFDLGADEYRITIPVYDEDMDVRTIRRYDPNCADQKMVNHILGDNTPSLYPLQRYDEIANGDTVIICEGEFDCMMLWQAGFKALTNTGNAGVWLPEWTEKLMSDLPRCNFIIIFDVHDKKMDYGQRMAKKVAKDLAAVGLTVSIAELDLPTAYRGGDISDYFAKEKRTSEELQHLIDNTTPIKASDISREDIYPPELEEEERSSKKATKTPISFQTLANATHARYYHEPIRIKGLVAGKRVSPYIVPSRYTAIIKTSEDESTVDKTIRPTDAVVLQLLDCSITAQKEVLRQMVGAPRGAAVRIMIHDTMNVEEIYLIPAVGTDSEEGPYVMRTAYYIGHGIATNQVYEFRGITLPDPRSQAATHLLHVAIKSETEIETFQLAPDDVTELRRTFHSLNVMDKLEEIADDLSDHVTHIYGRRDLHIAIDLAFHSAQGIVFDDIPLRKGWVELLVLGDTRTGKGFVTEGLTRFYRAGEVVSGENVSLAGLIGGLQRIGDRWSLVWGKIPLNDRRLVVIDEATGLGHQDIARMSRIRSEGIAEITKIISEKTTARTRLIWLANPRAHNDSTPRMIADYDHGVQAVAELVGAAEDIARFDMVLIVAQNEVNTDTINTKHVSSKAQKYTQPLCQKLLAWAWSRKPDQITFTSSAQATILKAAIALGHQFSPHVCLIQSEDVRFKIVRIATAAAMRTFSASENGEEVVVDEYHVTFAYNFLHYIYSKPCCGYSNLSAIHKERATLRDPKLVFHTLKKAVQMSNNQTNMMDLIDGLLEHRKLTGTDLADFTGIDTFQIRTIISDLVRSRALIKEHSYYIKKPAFKTFLSALKARLSNEGVTT
jgi:5S rRNA maturation endonuclease (ribonuclease M5)